SCAGMLRPMRPVPRLLATAVLCLSAAAVQAAVVERVEIRGLDEAMTDNVRLSLSLVESIGKDVSGRRMAYLVREAENEGREAAREPRGAVGAVGYYRPEVAVRRDREAGVVTIPVVPGEPVRVRNSSVAIEGEAARDPYMQDEIFTFLPGPGAIFDSSLYE